MADTYETRPLLLSRSLHDTFLDVLLGRYPQKSFGYLVSAGDPRRITDFIVFQDNIRNVVGWRDTFESYGRYFVEHADAGFVATPEESWAVQQRISDHQLVEVALFHTHLRHPANFSCIDYDLHLQRFPDLPHVIVSLRNPMRPQLRAFAVSSASVREIDVQISDADGGSHAVTVGRASAPQKDLVVSRAKESLALDATARPRCHDARTILCALKNLALLKDPLPFQELVIEGFLRDAPRRYFEWVYPQMVSIGGASFEMGSHDGAWRHFQGETPRHLVELSSFLLSRHLVTNELFGLLDERRLNHSVRDRPRPVTDVTWLDAALFALWVGCALPTEAQWEFACGAGSEDEWCCTNERDLGRYAWYSQNSKGAIKPVGTREANALGLFDLHGNVWEWCHDDYDPKYFHRSPLLDPMNGDHRAYVQRTSSADKVARGGSMHALAEMCRTRFRSHETADFFAADQGFRLARPSGVSEPRG